MKCLSTSLHVYIIYMYWYTVHCTPAHRYYTPLHRYTGTLYTGTLVHRYTGTPVHCTPEYTVHVQQGATKVLSDSPGLVE